MSGGPHEPAGRRSEPGPHRPDGAPTDQGRRQPARSAASTIDAALSEVERALGRVGGSDVPSGTPSDGEEPTVRASRRPAYASPEYPPPGLAPPERWAQGIGLLASVWRYRWAVVAASVVGLLLGLAAAYLQEPSYETSAVLRLDDPRAQGIFEARDAVGSETYIARELELISSPIVAERAAEALGGDIGVRDVQRATEVEGDHEILTIEVSAVDASPDRAAALANAVSDAYAEVREERHREEAEGLISELEEAESALQERVEELEAQLGVAADPSPLVVARHQSLVERLVDIESRVQEVAIEAELVGSGIRMTEPAAVPSSPSGPGPAVLGLLGLVVGAALAGGIAYWQAGRATRVWSTDEVARILGVPLLGRVPTPARKRSTLEDVLAIDPTEAEAYDFLLTSLEYELVRAGGSSILFTSARPQQGKTTATIHLGLACARSQRDVLIADGDLRSRRLSTLFGLDDVAGVAELDESTTSDLVEMIQTSDRRLHVLPAGGHTGHTQSHLRDQRFRERFRRLQGVVELMLVDSAPLLAVADTTVLAGLVDGVVVLVPARSSTEDLRRVRERSAFMSTPLLGFVYIGDDAVGSESYYGYHTAERATNLLGRALRAGRSDDA